MQHECFWLVEGAGIGDSGETDKTVCFAVNLLKKNLPLCWRWQIRSCIYVILPRQAQRSKPEGAKTWGGWTWLLSVEPQCLQHSAIEVNVRQPAISVPFTCHVRQDGYGYLEKPNGQMIKRDLSFIRTSQFSARQWWKMKVSSRWMKVWMKICEFLKQR